MDGRGARNRSSDSTGAKVRDTYGFELELTEEQQAQRLTCQGLENKAAQAWKPSADRRQLPSGRRLKKLVREGVPPQHRSWVWSEVSGASSLRESRPASYYASLVAQGHLSQSTRQIELVPRVRYLSDSWPDCSMQHQDLARTFPSHEWLQSLAGQAALSHVLTAFSVHNQEVGYCQGLNFVAGFLLLAVDGDEHAAFWLLLTLVEQILYPGVYSVNLSGAHIEMRTLDQLIADKLPKLSRHLSSLPADATIFATDWFLCLFCTSLPAESTARVWDALLMEGSKVLFRVALALLRMNEHTLLAKDNAGDVLRCLKAAVQQMHHHERLMDVAFEQLGSMPMAKISKLRQAHQVTVLSMLKERERSRKRQDVKHSTASAQQPE